MLNNILLLLGITLMYSTPLVFGALGGVISERSGVVNIGIEGMMTIGALAAVTFKADQNVSGIALNLLGPGIALFLARLMWGGGTQSPTITTLPKLFGSGAFQGTPWANLNVDITVVLGLAATLIVWFVLYKTKWGLRVRAVGEHPAAADTLGINVSRIRFICVVLSGILAGFGGASITLAIISQFTQTAVAGQGFIALAAVIFGKWTPHGAYGACLLFGMAQALVVILGGGAIAVPSQILAILPYALTLVVLVLFVGKAVAPKADGVPYEKGSRG